MGNLLILTQNVSGAGNNGYGSAGNLLILRQKSQNVNSAGNTAVRVIC